MMKTKSIMASAVHVVIVVLVPESEEGIGEQVVCYILHDPFVALSAKIRFRVFGHFGTTDVSRDGAKISEIRTDLL